MAKYLTLSQYFWVQQNTQKKNQTQSIYFSSKISRVWFFWPTTSSFVWFLQSQRHRLLQENSHSYPRVLINPFVEPSAYREQISPIWRKLDILSVISGFEALSGWETIRRGKRTKKVSNYQAKNKFEKLSRRTTAPWTTRLKCNPLFSQMKTFWLWRFMYKSQEVWDKLSSLKTIFQPTLHETLR